MKKVKKGDIFYSHNNFVTNPMLAKVIAISNDVAKVIVTLDGKHTKISKIFITNLQNSWFSDKAEFIRASEETRKMIYKEYSMKVANEVTERIKFASLVDQYESILNPNSFEKTVYDLDIV